MSTIQSNIPPIGGKKQRGRPPKANSISKLATVYGVSVRLLERAIFVRRYGVPELQALVERGKLKLGPAEYVACWPPDEQRECCLRGAKYLRELIPLVRMVDAEDKGRQKAEKAHRVCPHCGGL